jgi:hypothetical protein
VSLLAKAACQPTCFLLMYPIQLCASLLAKAGLTADLFLADVPDPTVGASLLAKAACQPTNFLLMYPIQL